MHNRVIGNAASGGWSGFSFPIFRKPLGPHRDAEMFPQYSDFNPSSRVTLEIDGNTAHSTAWWWNQGSGFYVGGEQYYDSSGRLKYNAGRGGTRSPCVEDELTGECISTHNTFTNSKIFLTPTGGLNSWTGKMDIINYETHDVGLAIESLSS